MKLRGFCITALVVLIVSHEAVSQPGRLQRPAGTVTSGVYLGTRVLTKLRPTAHDVQCFGTIGESHPVAYTLSVTGRRILVSDGSTDPVRQGRLKRKGAFKAKAKLRNGMYIDQYRLKGSRFHTAAPKIVEKFTRRFAEMPSKACIYTLLSEHLLRQ